MPCISYSKSSKSELLAFPLNAEDDDLTLVLIDDDFGDNTIFVLNPGG